jgi:hypothetical protein
VYAIVRPLFSELMSTGTVMRPAVLEGYVKKAGFSRLEALPIENLFFRFYRLHK